MDKKKDKKIITNNNNKDVSRYNSEHAYSGIIKDLLNNNTKNSSSDNINDISSLNTKDFSSDITKNRKSDSSSIKSSKDKDIKKKTKISKKKIITNIILSIILLLSIGGLVYSVLNFIDWTKDNEVTKEQIDIINEVSSIEETSGGEAVNQEEEEPESIYWAYMKMNMISVDFTELKNNNKDTKGWIQVNGTNINYPFVQTSNNSYYLTHSFDKKYTDAGWVFMDYRNNPENFDKNTIIYAHARKDRTMFGSLKNILKSDWYKNSDNHIIKLSTEKENTLWQVFSVYHIETESYYITTSFQNDEEFEKFINTLKNRSTLKFDAKVNKNDKILTLSTCYNETQKVVLHAKLIKRESR